MTAKYDASRRMCVVGFWTAGLSLIFGLILSILAILLLVIQTVNEASLLGRGISILALFFCVGMLLIGISRKVDHNGYESAKSAALYNLF